MITPAIKHIHICVTVVLSFSDMTQISNICKLFIYAQLFFVAKGSSLVYQFRTIIIICSGGSFETRTLLKFKVSFTTASKLVRKSSANLIVRYRSPNCKNTFQTCYQVDNNDSQHLASSAPA